MTYLSFWESQVNGHVQRKSWKLPTHPQKKKTLHVLHNLKICLQKTLFLVRQSYPQQKMIHDSWYSCEFFQRFQHSKPQTPAQHPSNKNKSAPSPSPSWDLLGETKKRLVNPNKLSYKITRSNNLKKVIYIIAQQNIQAREANLWVESNVRHRKTLLRALVRGCWQPTETPSWEGLCSVLLAHKPPQPPKKQLNFHKTTPASQKKKNSHLKKSPNLPTEHPNSQFG